MAINLASLNQIPNMLNQIDLQRLNKIKLDIALLGLRFPVAAIANRTGTDKGHISKMLSGKAACSNNFINRFYASFEKELEKAKADRKASQIAVSLAPDIHRSERLKTIATALSEWSAILHQMV